MGAKKNSAGVFWYLLPHITSGGARSTYSSRAGSLRNQSLNDFCCIFGVIGPGATRRSQAPEATACAEAKYSLKSGGYFHDFLVLYFSANIGGRAGHSLYFSFLAISNEIRGARRGGMALDVQQRG